MARPIKIRATYARDQIFLSQLREAVEKDTRISKTTKRQALKKLGELMIVFINADMEVQQSKDAVNEDG